MAQAPPPRPPLTFIVAVTPNGVMGKDGKLPWDLPEDRAFFRDMTMGHAIIMGRRTWDERGVPLPGRRNIVVSRTGHVSGTGREVVNTIEEAIILARATDPDPFVVGGAHIFRAAYP
jgi:dihydrofolate reductase